MMNTSGRDIKYFAQQEIKTNKAENKVAQFKEKIAQYKNNEKLWDKTVKEVQHRIELFK